MQNVQLILKNGATEEYAIKAIEEALKLESVQEEIGDKEIVKIIVVKDRVVNFVTK